MTLEETGEHEFRRRAFLAASANSRRVVWLRRAIVSACLGGTTLLAAVAVFNPFAGRDAQFTTEATSLDGSRIVMEKPRLSGYRDDGRPYDLRAANGVQDIKTPNIVELIDIEAKLDTAEQSIVHLSAPSGVYDSSKDTLNLSGDIHISSEGRFDIRMQTADINFKAGTVDSDRPLTASMPSGVIASQRLQITENGKRIKFLGGVETTLTPAVAPAGNESGK